MFAMDQSWKSNWMVKRLDIDSCNGKRSEKLAVIERLYSAQAG